MNIFAVSTDPVECARALDDKRLRKMIVESAQMLCTVVNVLGATAPYKTTHSKHPCTVWTGSTRENFKWHLSLLKAMNEEHIYRFGRDHTSYLKCFEFLSGCTTLVKQGELTKHVNCSFFKDTDVYVAYQLTLEEKFKNDKLTPKFTRRGKTIFGGKNES